MTDSKRKPRKRRPGNSRTGARKATAEANKSADGKLRMKMRIVALESRMTVLERFVEAINNPLAQARADEVRDYVGDNPISTRSEEE